MIFCQYCQSSLPDGALFCNRCGRPLKANPSEPIYNPNAPTALSNPHQFLSLSSNNPTIISQPFTPAKKQEDEEQRDRVIPLPFPAPSAPSVPHVPTVQGTPQLNIVPSVQGTPQTIPTGATSAQLPPTGATSAQLPPTQASAVKTGMGTAGKTMRAAGTIGKGTRVATGTTAKTVATAGTAKIVVIVAVCAAVVLSGLVATPLILAKVRQGNSSSSGSSITKPTPTLSPTPSLDQLSVDISSQDGNIYALNASNGAQRWKYSTGSQGSSQIQVANGVVYFITDNDNTQSSTMYALDVHSGTLLHTFKIPYFFLETGGWIPLFTIANGAIYLTAPSMIFAINSSDGTQLWQYSWFGRSASAPIVVNNVVYSVTGIGIIYAFRANDGTLLWKYDLGNPPQGSLMGTHPALVIMNNTLYVPGWFNNSVYAINLNNQALQWHVHINNQISSTSFGANTLYAANGTIYINAPSTIYALRADNGTQLWSKNNISLQFTDTNTLYSFGVDANGSHTNDLYALSSSDGTTIWHIQTGSTKSFTSTIIGITHMILYVTTDTTLYALHTNDGSILWQAPVAGSSGSIGGP